MNAYSHDSYFYRIVHKAGTTELGFIAAEIASRDTIPTFEFWDRDWVGPYDSEDEASEAVMEAIVSSIVMETTTRPNLYEQN